MSQSDGGRHDDDPTTRILAHAPLAVVTSPRCALRVIAGPDVGLTVAFDDVATRRVFLGKSEACDLRLTDRAVSRRHAAIEMTSGGPRLVDLDSSNGTWVGALRVKEAYLTTGATLTVGATTLRFEVDATECVIPASQETRFHRVIGASAEMRRLYPLFERLAGTMVPVLIEGETGTGKEVLAESIHEASARHGGPFVVFDCTTVSAALLEAEIFGHERGAFTGADTVRRGLFEEANGGTLFIDEIGDLDLTLQSKLLRAIEKSEVRRIGASRWTQVDVRILAATRRDLDREVQARRFRDDLFYRLAVARVELPPLRKRQGDVALLARCFWIALGGKDAELPSAVVQRFEDYAWPGNVRELYNAVARQLAMGEVGHGERMPGDDDARYATAPDFVERFVREGMPLPRARQEVVQALEQRYVKRMLELHGGSVSRAAAASGIGRRYFQMIRAKG
jgi:two-component system response regulator HydG